MKDKWVQDAKTIDASSIITDITLRNLGYIRRTGSKYVTGPSKSGNSDDVGIYFRAPISK